MYCYKCGAECSTKSTRCKKCNAVLSLVPPYADSSTYKSADPAKEYRTYVREVRKASSLRNMRLSRKKDKKPTAVKETAELIIYKPAQPPIKKLTVGDVVAFHEDCIAKANASYEREVASVKAFYEPKIAAMKGREKEAEDEAYHGALADADERRSQTLRGIGSVKDSAKALKEARIAAAESYRMLPPEDDSRKVHAFIQYIHKRDDNNKDQKEAFACSLVVGLILLIIGFIFYFLAYKVSPDPSIINKVLVLTSFEFIVFCAGVSVGGVMFLTGFIGVLVRWLSSRKYRNLLNHLRIYYKIGTNG